VRSNTDAVLELPIFKVNAGQAASFPGWSLRAEGDHVSMLLSESATMTKTMLQLLLLLLMLLSLYLLLLLLLIPKSQLTMY
jgi:hypothetical protein